MQQVKQTLLGKFPGYNPRIIELSLYRQENFRLWIHKMNKILTILLPYITHSIQNMNKFVPYYNPLVIDQEPYPFQNFVNGYVIKILDWPQLSKIPSITKFQYDEQVINKIPTIALGQMIQMPRRSQYQYSPDIIFRIISNMTIIHEVIKYIDTTGDMRNPILIENINKIRPFHRFNPMNITFAPVPTLSIRMKQKEPSSPLSIPGPSMPMTPQSTRKSRSMSQQQQRTRGSISAGTASGSSRMRSSPLVIDVIKSQNQKIRRLRRTRGKELDGRTVQFLTQLCQIYRLPHSRKNKKSLVKSIVDHEIQNKILDY